MRSLWKCVKKFNVGWKNLSSVINNKSYSKILLYFYVFRKSLLPNIYDSFPKSHRNINPALTTTLNRQSVAIPACSDNNNNRIDCTRESKRRSNSKGNTNHTLRLRLLSARCRFLHGLLGCCCCFASSSSSSQNIWQPWSLDVGVCVRVKLVCCFIFLRFVCTLWERCSPASATADRVSDIDNLLGYATGLFCRLGPLWKRGFRGRFFVQRFVCVYFVLFARKGKSTRTGRTSRRQVEGLYDSLMTFDCLLMLAALFVLPLSRSPGIDTPSYGTRRDKSFKWL